MVRCISGCTAASTWPRSSSACASSSVSRARSVADAIEPLMRCWPGTTRSTVVPSWAIRSFTERWAPRPNATIAITAETPITMPSMVRNERSLFARSASSATVKVSKISMSAPSPLAAAARSPERAAAGGFLARLGLRVGARGLRLRHAQQHHLLTLLHARDHLGIVVVTEADLDASRLDADRVLHEHHL